MQTNKRLPVFFIFLLMLLAGSIVHAGDPNGTWTSSTGNTVKLWANMQTVSVSVTTPQGQVWKWNGWWTRFSDYFAYQTNDGIRYCSFANSNTIHVKNPNGSITTWVRSAQQAPKQSYNNQQSNNSNITGNWTSSSGNIIQVSMNGNQIFVTVIDRQGRRSQGIGRWIQYGKTFDYSIANFSGVAVCTVVNSRRIDVNYNGWTTWTR